MKTQEVENSRTLLRQAIASLSQEKPAVEGALQSLREIERLISMLETEILDQKNSLLNWIEPAFVSRIRQKNRSEILEYLENTGRDLTEQDGIVQIHLASGEIIFLERPFHLTDGFLIGGTPFDPNEAYAALKVERIEKISFSI